MDTSSRRRHPLRSPIDFWRAVLPVAGALVFALLAIGRIPSQDTHEALLTALRAIDISHASLQRDVLQARAGFLRNYDPIVRSVVDLNATITRLGKLLPESGVKNITHLQASLLNLARAIQGDEKLVENFKTGNALLQNSLSLSNQLLTELHSNTDPNVTKVMRGSPDLGNMMMRFAGKPEQRFADVIRQNLKKIHESDVTSNRAIMAYIAHAEMVLETLPSVDRTINAIQASRTTFEAQTLLTQYLDAYGLMSVKASWSRMFLGTMTGLLSLYVAVLVFRLRNQTQKLKQQLDFASLSCQLKTHFERRGSSSEQAISYAVERLAEFFDASHYNLAIVDIDTRGVKQSFGEINHRIPSFAIDRFCSEFQETDAKKTLNRDHYFYQNLRPGGIKALAEGKLSVGSIVAAAIDSNVIGVLLLEHNHVRKRPSTDETRLLGQAMVGLTQNIWLHGERSAKELLEARLEHSERLEAVGTLAGGIAHEFNNVLAAIFGYGEMALQQRGISERARHCIHEILASGQRAKHITDQILTFSRKRERINKPFDMREAINEIIPLIRLTNSGPIELTASISEILPAVIGNPIEIQQVIMNLCKNAAEALKDSGRIDVTVRHVDVASKQFLSHGELHPGSYVLVSVVDDGAGIPKKVLPHVFEPFFTTKGALGGTGLGLAAVHGHVVGMNGKIHVASTPGAGTHFNLYFPTTLQKPVALAQFFNERMVPTGNGETVLIAQSDENLRLMYEEKIAALGYEPVGFPNLERLKQWLKNSATHPDLILLDADLWEILPTLEEISALHPAKTFIMADPEKDAIDPIYITETLILRKPVSSVSLATALFNAIGGSIRSSESGRQASTTIG